MVKTFWMTAKIPSFSPFVTVDSVWSLQEIEEPVTQRSCLWNWISLLEQIQTAWSIVSPFVDWFHNFGFSKSSLFAARSKEPFHSTEEANCNLIMPSNCMTLQSRTAKWMEHRKPQIAILMASGWCLSINPRYRVCAHFVLSLDFRTASFIQKATNFCYQPQKKAFWLWRFQGPDRYGMEGNFLLRESPRLGERVVDIDW